MDPDRIDLARARAKGLLAIAVLLIVLAGFMYVMAPAWSEPMFGGPRSDGIPASLLAFVVGLGGMFFGLACMWRLYRAPTKYESARWRYRDRD